MLLGKLFLMIGAGLLGIDPLIFYFSWQALLLTISSFALLFILISLITFVLIGQDSPRILFHGGIRAEQTPRISPLPAAASALLLLGGYALAASASASSVEVIMLPVVAITVAGTYLFYTQLSLYIAMSFAVCGGSIGIRPI